MNKAAIKNFAVEARKKLIASVKDKAGRIGITNENITEAISKGEGYAVFPTHIGSETTLVGKELKQRENLVNRIKEKGYESVMEEVAYTWFNRIIAVRFMEINDYLPSRIRVLSSETKGKFEPDIVTQAPKIDLELTQQEIEEIISLKEKNEMDKLFRMLFIKQCNELGEILPELFENTSKYNKDYTEILLDISYTNEDGVIRDLLKIDEADFLDAVEIIGWMYQYYNTEPKDETFALLKKNIKITKERIPAATQLFTPDWIVRYMVENSLGRLWLEGHTNDTLKTNWKYYLEEAEQEPNVVEQLVKIRAEYKNINPEDIKVIDPCMGSGHILVYAFEVLMQIYESCGYTQRDAASLIIEKNLYGLDIDDRAYQLAYFAVMMKGRKYDRRFLTKGITPNLCPIEESNSLISFEQDAGQLKIDDLHKETANYLVTTFRDAKEYGSILNIEQRDYDGLLKYIEELLQNGVEDLFMSQWLNSIATVMPALIKQAKIIAQKYDVVVTNPPYMGNRGMSNKLSDYVRKEYPESKSDLFSVFTVKSRLMSKKNGYYALITQPSLLFLSSFELLRNSIAKEQAIVTVLHMGRGIFGIDFGSASFVIQNTVVSSYRGQYFRLHERTFQYIDAEDIKNLYLNAKNNHEYKFNFSTYVANEDSSFIQEEDEEVSSNKELQLYFVANQLDFSKIPGCPFAYWASSKIIDTFNEKKLSDVANPRQGMATGENNRFLRFWYEVEYIKCGFGFASRDEARESNLKWFPYNKGGDFRKWYGNNEYLVNWEYDGMEICNFKDSNGKLRSRPQNTQFYFKPSLTWSFVSSTSFGVRFSPQGALFDIGGSSVFPKEQELTYILGFLGSKLSFEYMKIQNPTMNFQVGNVANLPIIFNNSYKNKIDNLVSNNILISKTDWDSFETSWDFKTHPLVSHRFFDINTNGPSKMAGIKYAYKNWEIQARHRFEQLKAKEEELNRIFIEIYGLQDELTPEVEDKDITIRKADLQRDIRSFISYAVGCMFGRYSLDVEGLAYAGGEWDDSKYKTFIPDKDNVIPITDEEYFDDDIVARFVKFVKVVYGEDTLEENLDFIANALGNKGSTSREVIRNYFLKDFYKDHVKTYQKRPIYWLFDSGKENGFKALIYLHRYNEDTVGRVRADYLHKTQAAIENAIAHCDVVLESNASASDKAKAVKQKEKLVKQLAETRIYDQAIAHIAHQRISLDLDDGVVANYAKFQGVVVSSEGKKSVKVDLLGKI